MMKALFSRFNRGLSKEKDRNDPPSKDKDLLPANAREKLPQLPPLPEWPPPQRMSATSATSFTSPFKPLPDVSLRPFQLPQDAFLSTSLPASQLSPPPTPTQSRPFSPSVRREEGTSTPDTIVAPQNDHDLSFQNSRKTTNGSLSTAMGSEVHKKVVFLSPPPTPSAQERSLPDTPGNGTAPAQLPAKTTLSRPQSSPHGKDPRGSTSTAASSSKTDLPSARVSVKATSTRSVTSPAPSKGLDAASLHQSLRSGTPYSQMSQNSSRILAAASWSEGAEEDLVSNLGPRERTRQEVLWEILASEERYVADLIKMKDTFIEPLLHPFSFGASSPTPHLGYDEYPRVDSPVESVEQLPIAARFMSPTGFRSDTPTSPTPTSMRRDGKETPVIDGESMDTDGEDENDDRLGKSYTKGHSADAREAAKHNHPRSPYRMTGGKSVPFPSRSQHSLPQPQRANLNASTHSLGRHSVVYDRDRKHSQDQNTMVDRQVTPTPTTTSRVLRKFRRSTTTPETLAVVNAVAPHQLPEDLRICLEVVENDVLDGHVRLSEGLRKRYDEQYPLVRSLADVFVSNSQLFHGYAKFVLHLERALEQVDNALSADTEKKPKKQDAAEWIKVCKYLRKLEEIAVDKGETGLAISLSKPFQRLLKYPLLFQNLLFHTDPSTFEYESTLQMVAEVETIVRSIEDEKIQKEERDKTRDVFARIEGLDKVKQLALPKPSRVLLEERLYMPIQTSKGSSTPPSAMVKGKTSFKRLSDVLHSGTGIGGKKDLWLVVFNDVVLQCQRTGQTSLPLVAVTSGRTTSLPEMQGKAKYATTGRRNIITKPRNLYKFIKIETWAIGDVIQPREGVVSMEDVVRSRAQVHSGIQPRIVPLPDDNEDDGASSDHSDTKSKMSFSYWGADKVTIQNPAVKARQQGTNGRGRRVSPGTSSYGRESSANAKFGTRLIASDQSLPNGTRPVSRRTQGPPAKHRTPLADDTQSAKATVTRPAWDSNTRSAQAKQRPRLISQSGAAKATTTPATSPNAKHLSSPALSEDSGVGLYRQFIAQDPSITESRSKS